MRRRIGFHEAKGLRLFWVAILAQLCAIAPAQVFVDGALDPAGDGLSWATAYNNIQAAIDDPRSATEEIRVARAFYDGNIVMASGRRIIGSVEVPPLRTDKGLPPIIIIIRPERSVIQGNGMDGDSSRGVIYDGVSNTLLQNFIIQDHVTTSTDAYAGNGAGLFFRNSDASNAVEQLYVYDNLGTDGGGIYCFNASPQITSSDIGSNRARDDGGGLYCTSGSMPDIQGCIFGKNFSEDRGGGLYASVNSSLSLTGVDVYANSAQQGGGLFLRDGSSGIVRNSRIFACNAAVQGAAVGCSENATLQISDSLLDSNDSSQGIIVAENSSVLLDRIYLAYNDTSMLGLVTLIDCPNAQIRDSYLYQNNSKFPLSVIHQVNGSLSVERCQFIGNLGAPRAITNSGTGSLNLSNSTFAFNSIESDALILLTSDSTSLISSCTIDNSTVGVGLGVNAQATIRNTIFSNLGFDAIHEMSVGADATVENCLFSRVDGSVLIDEAGLANFQTAAAMNQFVNQASGNIDGEAVYIQESPEAFRRNATGGEPVSEFVFEFIFANAELTTDSLIGFALKSQGSTAGVYPIIGNTHDTIRAIVIEKPLGNLELVDLRPTIDSAAVDRGSQVSAPTADLLGQPRPVDAPDIGGSGDLAYDIGAYELQDGMFSEAVYVAESFEGPDDAVRTGLSWNRPYATIQDAIDDPRSASAPILVAAGMYRGNIMMASNRKIYGGYINGMPPGTTVKSIPPTLIFGDGATTPSRGMVFSGTVDTLVQDVYIQNHVTTDTDGFGGNGAGLLFLNCDDTNRVRSVRISDNTGSDGGGIACFTSSPEISDSTLFSNHARDDGGGIYCNSGSSAVILGSYLQFNSAEDLGGGLYASISSNPFVSDCQISNNIAQMGGGFYFRDNSAGFVTGSSIYENTAQDAGALGCAQNSGVQVTESRLFGNSAQNGGIVTANGSSLQLRNIQMFANECGPGAIVHSIDSENVVLAECDIYDNDTLDRGAVYVRNGSMNISQGYFLNNATSSVSGLTSTGDAEVSMVNSVFHANQGQTDAAILVTSQSTTTISSCTFNFNNGGIRLDQQGQLSIDNSILSNLGNIGIFENTTSADASVLNCLFDQIEGGAFTDEGGLATFQTANALNQFVTQATGNIDGPAIYNYLSESMNIDTPVLISTLLPNNQYKLTTNYDEFTTGALAGLMIQGGSTGRFYPIVDNSGNTITVIGNTYNDSSLRIMDFRPTIDSAAVDRGSNLLAPSTDLLGKTRPVDTPDVGETGDLAFDIGAFELQADQFSQAVYVAAEILIDPNAVLTGLSWDRPYPTIQQAIDDPRSATYPIFVAGGDYMENIELASGRQIFGSLEVGDTEPNYPEITIERDKQLRLGITTTIYNEAIKGTATGGHLVRAVDLSDVFMTHFRLIGGHAMDATGENSNGGGLYAENLADTVRFEALEIISCTATNRGGAIYIAGGAPFLQHMVIQENQANNGGAIALVSGTSARFNGTEIQGGRAMVSGGAIYANASSPTFTNMVLSFNSAPLGGGLVFDSLASGSFASSTISDSSSDAGGAMFIRNSNPVVEYNAFNYNRSAQLGGGILIDNASPQIRSNSFSNNDSTQDGGAIAMRNGASPLITNNFFRGNHAENGSGGGILAQSNSVATISGCEFIQNNASGSESYGGCVAVRNATAQLTNSVFYTSSARFGGAVAFQNAQGATDRCWFNSNNAGSGGAAYFTDSSNSLTNSVFRRNDANEGGAIYVDQGSPMIVNNTFWNNTAPGPWQTIAINSASPSLVNNLFNGFGEPYIGFISPLGEFSQLANNLFPEERQILRLFNDNVITTVSIVNEQTNATANIVGDARISEDLEYSALSGTYEYASSHYVDEMPEFFFNRDIKTLVTSGAIVTTLLDEDASFTPGALVGRLFYIPSTGDYRRVRANTENTIQFWDFISSGSNDYYMLDATPVPSSAAIDAGTTATLAMVDINGQARPFDYPFVSHPDPATTFDIGAVEVVDVDFVDLLVKYLLGQFETREGDPILEAIDYNGDDVIDAADLVTLIP